MSGFQPGAVTIEIEKVGLAPLTRTVAIDRDGRADAVEAPVEGDDLRLRFVATGRLEGVVRDDSRGISGAYIEVPYASRAGAETGPDGRYRLGGVEPGLQVVRLQLTRRTDVGRVSSVWTRRVEISPDEVTRVDFDCSSSRRVDLVVHVLDRRDDDDPYRDFLGIRRIESDGGNGFHAGFIDEQGLTMVPYLQPGHYRFGNDVGRIFDLTRPGHVELDYRHAPGGVEGAVVDGVTGAPVSQAWFSLIRVDADGDFPPQPRGFHVGTDGSFDVDNVMPGPYRVTVISARRTSLRDVDATHHGRRPTSPRDSGSSFNRASR